MKAIYFLFALLLGVLIGSYYASIDAGQSQSDTIIMVDTVTRIDTVTLIPTVPPVVTSRVRTDTLYIIRCDTIEEPIPIPIEQRRYDDSLYTAYVSGYNPALDSIKLHHPTQSVIIDRIIKPPSSSRWSIVVNAGYGVTPKGFAPYIGVGVGYSIFSF